MNSSPALRITNEFCRQSVELLNQAEIKSRHCLEQLSDDQIWWRPEPSINSVGNLIRHIVGNLRQWGIVPLTGEKDDRDRPREFAASESLSRSELIDRQTKTIAQAGQLWSQLEPEQLNKPMLIQGFEVSLLQAIMHTSTHFVGHTHQIVLLTRIQLGSEYKFQWTSDDDRGSLPV